MITDPHQIGGGPSHETLSKLFGSLESMAQGIIQKKIGRKGRKVPRKQPHSFCQYCTGTFDDWADTEIPTLKGGTCPECQEMLDQGFVGISSETQFKGFIKAPNLGPFIYACEQKNLLRIIDLAPHNFVALLKTVKVELPKKTDERPTPQPPNDHPIS